MERSPIHVSSSLLKEFIHISEICLNKIFVNFKIVNLPFLRLLLKWCLNGVRNSSTRNQLVHIQLISLAFTLNNVLILNCFSSMFLL